MRGEDFGGSVRRRAAAIVGAAGMFLVVPLFGDVDPVFLAMSVVLLVISLGIHEAAHGWVALKCGDTTARDLGRITLNPIPHIDLTYTILLPAALLWWSHGTFAFGGAKPVPVSFHRLRHPWRDMCLVALAGPVSNLLLAAFFVAAYHFFVRTGLYSSPGDTIAQRSMDFLPSVLSTVFLTNVVLAVFNLLPIPPLDGSRVMAWLLPAGIREKYASLETVGMILVFGFVAVRYFVPGSFNFLDHWILVVARGIESVVTNGGRW